MASARSLSIIGTAGVAAFIASACTEAPTSLLGGGHPAKEARVHLGTAATLSQADSLFRSYLASSGLGKDRFAHLGQTSGSANGVLFTADDDPLADDAAAVITNRSTNIYTYGDGSAITDFDTYFKGEMGSIEGLITAHVGENSQSFAPVRITGPGDLSGGIRHLHAVSVATTSQPGCVTYDARGYHEAWRTLLGFEYGRVAEQSVDIQMAGCGDPGTNPGGGNGGGGGGDPGGYYVIVSYCYGDYWWDFSLQRYVVDAICGQYSFRMQEQT